MDAPIDGGAVATLNAAIIQAQAMIEAGKMQAEASRATGIAAIAAAAVAFVSAIIASGPQRREHEARIDGLRFTIRVLLERMYIDNLKLDLDAHMAPMNVARAWDCPTLPPQLSLERNEDHALLGPRFVDAMVALHKALHEMELWCSGINHRLYPPNAVEREYERGIEKQTTRKDAYRRRLHALRLLVTAARDAGMPLPARLLFALTRRKREAAAAKIEKALGRI